MEQGLIHATGKGPSILSPEGQQTSQTHGALIDGSVVHHRRGHSQVLQLANEVEYSSGKRREVVVTQRPSELQDMRDSRRKSRCESHRLARAPAV